jgi:hypothetical protein
LKEKKNRIFLIEINMACPINHGIPTGAILPSIRMEPELQNYESNLLLVDYYYKFYKRYGIMRDEMVVVMPSVMSSDILVGLMNLKYIED